mgnify:FL=1
MIEILSIFLTLFSLFLFSNFPLNFFLTKKKFSSLEISFNESLIINIIINCNVLLFFSFISVKLEQIFLFFSLFAIILIILFYKEYFLLFKKNLLANLAFITLFYALSIFIIKNAYLEWDGLAHWIFKSSVYFQGGGYKDLVGLPMDYYPHLGSYIWAYFWKNSLLQIEYSGRLFFIFIFMMSIFTIGNQLNKNFSKFDKIVLVSILIYLTTNTFLFGGYQEYFIFFIFFCFLYFFKKFFIEKQNTSNIYLEFLLILTSNCILWIKQEGFFYFFLINLVFLVHSKISNTNKIRYILIIISLVLIFYLIRYNFFGFFKFNEDVVNNETLKNLNLIYLGSKVFIISKYFIITFFKYPIWILIIFCFIYLKFKTSFFEYNKFVISYLVITFTFIYLIFLNTTMDINWLIPLTLNRVLFATSGFVIFLCIELLNRLRIRV